MRDWDATRVASAAGATVVAAAPAGPTRAVVDSREAGPGDLFVGLRGELGGARDAAAGGIHVERRHTQRATRGVPGPLKRRIGARVDHWRGRVELPHLTTVEVN